MTLLHRGLAERPDELPVIEQAGQDHRGAAEQQGHPGIDQDRREKIENGPRPAIFPKDQT